LPRILVLEDDFRMSLELLKTLVLAGYDAVGAVSGRQAEKMLDERETDLVICDIDMPGGDGLESISRLRRRPEHPTIIAVSRRNEPALLESARVCGADHILIDPIDPEVLLQTVEGLLDARAPSNV